MNRDYLRQLTKEFSDNSPTNYLSPPAEDAETLDKLADEFFANNFARNNYHGDDNDFTAFNKGKSDEYVGMRFFLP